MSCLVLEVRPTPGSTIETAIVDAVHLARQLDLAWIDLPFNDWRVTVYPRGKALLFNCHTIVCEWDEGRGFSWRGNPLW